MKHNWTSVMDSLPEEGRGVEWKTEHASTPMGITPTHWRYVEEAPQAHLAALPEGGPTDEEILQVGKSSESDFEYTEEMRQLFAAHTAKAVEAMEQKWRDQLAAKDVEIAELKARTAEVRAANRCQVCGIEIGPTGHFCAGAPSLTMGGWAK